MSENSKFCYKNSKYQNFTPVFFLLIQEENDNSNMFCKFQLHSMHNILKWRLKISKIWARLQPPPPSDFDALPYPRVRWYPQFYFHQNDRKGCTRDYLYALDHFLQRFGAIRKNRKGVQPPAPLVRRGLKTLFLHHLFVYFVFVRLLVCLFCFLCAFCLFVVCFYCCLLLL